MNEGTAYVVLEMIKSIAQLTLILGAIGVAIGVIYCVVWLKDD